MRRLIRIVRNILEHVTRFDSMHARYARSTPWVGHRAIVEAIRDRDGLRAGRSMQEHIEQARLGIVSAYVAHPPKLSLPLLEYRPALGLAGWPASGRAEPKKKAVHASSVHVGP